MVNQVAPVGVPVANPPIRPNQMALIQNIAPAFAAMQNQNIPLDQRVNAIARVIGNAIPQAIQALNDLEIKVEGLDDDKKNLEERLDQAQEVIGNLDEKVNSLEGEKEDIKNKLIETQNEIDEAHIKEETRKLLTSNISDVICNMGLAVSATPLAVFGEVAVAAAFGAASIPAIPLAITPVAIYTVIDKYNRDEKKARLDTYMKDYLDAFPQATKRQAFDNASEKLKECPYFDDDFEVPYSFDYDAYGD